MIFFPGTIMKRAIIIYAPDDAGLKNAAERIKQTLSNEKYPADIKTSKEASITDIAASDVIIVGFKGAKKKVHPDFAGIDRALRGINLAGRIAAYFSTEHEDAMEHFRKSFRDSDIAIFETPLILSPGEDGGKVIPDWVQKLLSCYKEGSDVGQA
jgi:flavodoxin